MLPVYSIIRVRVGVSFEYIDITSIFNLARFRCWNMFFIMYHDMVEHTDACRFVWSCRCVNIVVERQYDLLLETLEQVLHVRTIVQSRKANRIHVESQLDDSR